MNRVNLNFHQTFGPEREYIGRLLALADGHSAYSKEEIFERTGIPTGSSSGKVEPHIHYAVLMGLLTDEVTHGEHTLARTVLGEQVAQADPHLVEPISMMLCHYNMSSPPGGADLWCFLFNRVVPSLGLRLDTDTLRAVTSNEFRRQRVNLTPLRTCYTADKCLGALNLVSEEGKYWCFKGIPYQSDFRYGYAYTLLRTWDALLPERRELTLDEVQNVLGWDKPFLWSDRETHNILDSLCDLGLIAVNKQLTPITVIRNALQNSVITKLYSLLV